MMQKSVVLAVLAGSLAVGTGVAAGASPVQGSIVGPVTAVKGATFTVQTPANLGVPKNSSKVTVVSSTAITEQSPASRSALKKGLCASAMGTRNSKGVVAAQRITLTKPVKGACDTGFRRGGSRPGGGSSTTPSGGQGPGGGQRPPGNGGFSGNGNFGFAFGTITAVKGSTLQIKGRARETTTGTTTTTTTTKVTLSAKTQLEQTVQVKPAAIQVKLCAFVRGTSSDKGATVKADSVALSKPTANGCSGGFRRP
jgi:hypothetical protein